ncbi:hypothetical protein J6590_042342 [Homalodisca vitripennis]|nr:hypothetical protein J6590_042342 [Homalodisca vitripennis]
MGFVGVDEPKSAAFAYLRTPIRFLPWTLFGEVCRPLRVIVYIRPCCATGCKLYTVLSSPDCHLGQNRGRKRESGAAVAAFKRLKGGEATTNSSRPRALSMAAIYRSDDATGSHSCALPPALRPFAVAVGFYREWRN